MSSSFEAYSTHLAIKAHITTKSYNYFKYNKKTNATHKSFEERTDKYFYNKLANKFSKSPTKDRTLCDLERFVLYHVTFHPNLFIRDWFSFEQEQSYHEWMRVFDSLDYQLTNSLQEIKESQLVDYLKSHDIMICDLMRGKISFHFAAALNACFKWKQKNDLFSNKTLLLEKYEVFMTYDKKKLLDSIKTLLYQYKYNAG